MFMNGEHVRISKESLVAYFKAYYLKIGARSSVVG
jgi:hypothetical protein